MNAAHSTQTNATEDRRLVELVDEITVKLQAGETCDVDHYTSRYPEYADRLRDWMTVMTAMAELGHSLAVGGARPSLQSASGDASPALPQADVYPTGILGDFRILRELGRGGMGVVYEAEQLSIGRRVALKVLPFAAMLDKQQLNRFKNEARAAGTLDHPNIVAIHSVGTERGVHYYAMQLIEGQSLAQLIADMKPGRPPSDKGAALKAAPIVAPAADTAKAALPTVRARGSAAFLTIPPFESREFFRAVARLGIQAAEALDHAHQNGILHRDIKPANLLVDDAGKLWITDFGLARIEQDAGMTMTGDLLGTLRYMSPEQALAKRVVVDHRSDIYSLGVTLYELLTLQPAFSGDDRQELLRQIAFDEPRKLRQVNSRIPLDLETIILKAIEKNPADRYTTASDFANDLRRYLEDQPINAKPQGAISAARKWSRRHRGLLVMTSATLLISGLVVAGSIGWVARDRAARRMIAGAAAADALDETTRLMDEKNWDKALAAVHRADDVLAGSYNEDLSNKAADLRKDIELVMRLNDIRGGPATESAMESGPRSFDPNADQKLTQAFQEYGIDVQTLAVADATGQIKQSRIGLELSTSLDSWASWRRRHIPRDEGWKRLTEIARLADPDPWRNRLRDALEKEGNERRASLIALVQSADASNLPLPTLALFVDSLNDAHVDKELYTAFLLAAWRGHPDDFSINKCLNRCYDGKPNQELRYAMIMYALRPESFIACNNLGKALSDNGFVDDAILAFQRANRLQPTNPVALVNLGVNLGRKGRSEESIAKLREALKHAPNFAPAHCILALQLIYKGRLDEAILHLREAIRLDPQDERYYTALVDSLVRADRLNEAMAELKRVQSEFGPSHHLTLAVSSQLVDALSCTNQHLLARRVAEEAVAVTTRELGADDPETLNARQRLVKVLLWGHYFADADAIYAQNLAHDTLKITQRTLGPDADQCIELSRALATLLKIRGHYQEALQRYEETLAHNRRVNGPVHTRNYDLMHDLASTLVDLNRNDEAATKLEAAIQGVRALTTENDWRPVEWSMELGIIKSKLGKYDEARQLLDHALELAGNGICEPGAHREMAWFLATANSDKHRDGRRAVKLATIARDKAQARNPGVLDFDVLAAAYAETGDFDSAVKWSNKAIALIKNDVIRKKYEKHLESFTARKPWRDVPDENKAATTSDHP